jgi:hypothetical protein
MNTTITISKNRFIALCVVLVLSLLAVLFLLLKPEKRLDVLYTVSYQDKRVPLSKETIEWFENNGYHTMILANAEEQMAFFETSTGNEINVCDSNAGKESNTLTNQKTYGSQSAADETCQLAPSLLLQQLSCAARGCTTKCLNPQGVKVCAHSISGKTYRSCHATNPPAPSEQTHKECPQQ